MSSKKTAQYVMLAEASYADLTTPNGYPITDNQDYFKALYGSGFAEKTDDGQIATLKNNWDVVTNWKDHTKESSFSATLFASKHRDA